jgi:autotransporter strand-loop-strand O-heptosyltransferase
MKEIFIKVNSKSLGDTLASTPSIRKVAKSYNSKVNVVTHVKEIFENNANIKNVYSFQEFEKLKLDKDKEIFETFCGIGVKNENGVEKKHATIDIRRFHAMDLGFDLLPEEMYYDFTPKNDKFIEIDKKYICLHISKTWDSRTYSSENWQTIISCLEQLNYYVVLVGNNASEVGFFNINKTVHNLKLNNGIDLTNKLNLSQLWHLLNKSLCVITMDSGVLHFAGTTDTYIIQLGSSINNKLRAPYRNGSQDYKYKYISGPCDIFCASNMKYGVKEWGSINGVPPLVSCLEKKATFECHPSPFEVIEFFLQNLYQKTVENKKYLFIAGHLSTGGGPKYLLWLINKIKNEGNDIKVIEWNLFSDQYTVQRNQIIDLVGKENFATVGTYYEQDETFYDKENQIKDFIVNYNPDYIHINDYIEQLAIKMPSQKFFEFLYDKNRTYKIAETLHDSARDVNDKTYLPDEFWFCTPYHMEKYTRKDIPAFLKEMTINKNIRPDRDSTLLSLDLDPSYVHVLQVGLFNKNKNQKFTFDLAKNFLDKKIQFHFIGNHCFIDECEIDKNQKNCKIWGERSDVDKFMSCMDVFVLPSLAELNPIALKEALSWNMPCFINRLKTFGSFNDNLINYIQDVDINNHLTETINKLSAKNKNTMTDSNEILHSFDPSPKLEIRGNLNYKYQIEFIDLNTDKIHHSGIINNNMWISCNVEYYCNWRIIVKNLSLDIEKHIDLDLKNKKVKIVNESPSLGDLISWVPYIQEFKKKHGCEVDFFTPNKDLFAKEYPDVNFYNYNDDVIKYIVPYYDSYRLGCFNSDHLNLCKKNYQSLGLQQIASTILGLEDKEIVTNVTVNNTDRKLNSKYVCISTVSTSGCKHWQHKDGWQNTVDYLNDLGYKVIVIQKEPLDYMDLKGLNNVIHPETKSLDEAITWLYNCEFFIGLSSGISWLAWALKKKVVMISGFTKEFNEFYTPYRLINSNVCNGCWNNVKNKFNPGDWNWCPEKKHTNNRFECSKEITFEMVKDKIDLLIKDLSSPAITNTDKAKNFDPFTYKEIFEWNQYEKYVQVDDNDFILDLGCSKGYFYFKHSNKNINYLGVDGSIDCIQDFLSNLNGDNRPKLINAVLDKNKNILNFESMFHDNRVNRSLSITFEDLIFIINRKIDFFKFDIEGYEKYFLYENLDLLKKYVKKFTGEFHFTSHVSDREASINILKNLKDDNELDFKLYSIDGFDITESFWNNTNYYNQIIISGFIK